MGETCSPVYSDEQAKAHAHADLSSVGALTRGIIAPYAINTSRRTNTVLLCRQYHNKRESVFGSCSDSARTITYRQGSDTLDRQEGSADSSGLSRTMGRFGIGGGSGVFRLSHNVWTDNKDK